MEKYYGLLKEEVFKNVDELHYKMYSDDYNYVVTEAGIVAAMQICDMFKRNEIEDPKVIIDVGSNVGPTSIYLADIFKNAIIHAIEPVPKIYDELVRNIQKFNLEKRIIPHNVALTSHAGIVHMTINDGNKRNLGMSIVDYRKNRKKMISVKSISLNEFLINEELDYIDCIKCDTEGSEFEIFSNFTMWDNINIYHIETHGRNFKFMCSENILDEIKNCDDLDEGLSNFLKRNIPGQERLLVRR